MRPKERPTFDNVLPRIHEYANNDALFSKEFNTALKELGGRRDPNIAMSMVTGMSTATNRIWILSLLANPQHRTQLMGILEGRGPQGEETSLQGVPTRSILRMATTWDHAQDPWGHKVLEQARGEDIEEWKRSVGVGDTEVDEIRLTAHVAAATKGQDMVYKYYRTITSDVEKSLQ